jgi:mRNA interferase RelE/StbE
MPQYEIVFARIARKELQALPQTIVARILKKVELLALNPRPYDSKNFMDVHVFWRIRVGVYRVIYIIDDDRKVVDVAIVRHRSEAYR